MKLRYAIYKNSVSKEEAYTFWTKNTLPKRHVRPYLENAVKVLEFFNETSQQWEKVPEIEIIRETPTMVAER